MLMRSHTMDGTRAFVRLSELRREDLGNADADGADAARLKHATCAEGLGRARRDALPFGGTGLRYVPAGLGECGILTCPMLVPESVLLYVAPQGCARHGSTLALRNGYHGRVFYLDITVDELALGTYEQRTEDMVAAILEALPRRPRAFFICGTCIDDLLGTDLDNLCKRLAERHDLPFSPLWLDPIIHGTMAPPPLRMKRSIYRLLCQAGPVSPAERDPHAVNLIGGFGPIAQGRCDLLRVLQRAGLDPVRQVATCSTYDDFLEMRTAARNLLIMPMAIGAARDMERELGIPFTMVRPSLDLDAMAREYERLSAELGVELPYEQELAQARAHLERSRSWLAGVHLAVGARDGCAAVASALLLAQLGARVVAVVADRVEPEAWPQLEELAHLAPDAMLMLQSSPQDACTHPATSGVHGVHDSSASNPSSDPALPTGARACGDAEETLPGVSVAVGLEAGHAFPDAPLAMPGRAGAGLGFCAATSLVDAVREALSGGRTAAGVLACGYARRDDESLRSRRTTHGISTFREVAL